MLQRNMVRVLLVLAVLSVPLAIYFFPDVVAFILNVIGALAPLWLPALLVAIGWPLWLTFARSQFVMSVPYSTIELKPGPETPRSARPMELVFYSLYHRTEVTPLSEYLLGHVRVPWSFEVLAHNNAVRFFVHLPTAHREAVESRIRSEYRDIDIDQVRDYSREVAFDPYTMNLAMCEYSLQKPDPYPLKTYIAVEGQKNNPDTFNELLEDLASTSEKEYVYLSFIVRPHQRERKDIFSQSRDSLHDDAHEEITHLLGHAGELHAVSDEKKKTIAAIESALKKPSFDCGIRALYMADRAHFMQNADERLRHLFDRFGDTELNSFQAYDPKTKIGWPLSELFTAVPALLSLYLLQLYRRRAFFAPPYYGNMFVLNTEELATLFHIPHFARGSALSNLRGVRLEPPQNLPV
jgi:hypothetical protein